MIERRLSSDEEVREKYQKVGVVIFVSNLKGEILVVQEHLDFPETQIKPGDYSVVCEASMEGEGWEETVIRGLTEELGFGKPELEEHFKFDPETSFLGEGLFLDDVLARVIVVYYTGDLGTLLSKTGDGEVTVVSWEQPQNLISYHLRTGVRRILSECLRDNLLENLERPSTKGLIPLTLENLNKALTS